MEEELGNLAAVLEVEVDSGGNGGEWLRLFFDCCSSSSSDSYSCSFFTAVFGADVIVALGLIENAIKLKCWPSCCRPCETKCFTNRTSVGKRSVGISENKPPSCGA